MDLFFMIIYLLMVFMLIGFLLFGYYIMVSVGITNLRMYYKAYSGRKKGLILVRIYQKIGITLYALAKKKGSDVVFVQGINKNKEASYILKSEEIYRNEMNLNCIDYFEDDVEPRSWKSKNTFTMSPYAFKNIMTNVVKSEIESRPFDDFLRKYGVMIGIGLLILVGILVFVILSQNDQIVELSTKLAGTRVVEA